MEAEDELPRVFGDYHLLALLGQGGMGEIYLAKRIGFSRDIQRYCVVKTLREDKVQDPTFLKRFEDEARVVVTLNHRNICHVFDVGRVGHEHYLAMELIEGVSLQSLQRSMSKQGVKPAPALACYIIDEVLEALGYAHRHKDPRTRAPLEIVHRDVSPQNVMVSFEGEVKLIDFGLVESTLKREHTAADMVVGKLLYMAPEQAQDEDVDARTDVFSVGVMLYEILLGERFYGEFERNDVIFYLVEGGYEPPGLAKLPEGLAQVIRRATAFDRAARYASCAELQADLRSIADQAGWRASPRDLREVIDLVNPEARATLEGALEEYWDVGVEPTRTGLASDAVVHLATAVVDLEELSRQVEQAKKAKGTRVDRSGPRAGPRARALPVEEDESEAPTRTSFEEGTLVVPSHAPVSMISALPGAPGSLARATAHLSSEPQTSPTMSASLRPMPTTPSGPPVTHPPVSAYPVSISGTPTDPSGPPDLPSVLSEDAPTQTRLPQNQPFSAPPPTGSNPAARPFVPPPHSASAPVAPAPAPDRSLMPLLVLALVLPVLGAAIGFLWMQASADDPPPEPLTQTQPPDPVPDPAPPEPDPVEPDPVEPDPVEPDPVEPPEPTPVVEEDAGAPELAVNDDPVVEDPAPQARKRRRARRARRRTPPPPPKPTKPPMTKLRNLGDHFAYLERYCQTRAPTCTRKVLADKRKIPVLDARGLTQLTRSAEACVARCRR